MCNLCSVVILRKAIVSERNRINELKYRFSFVPLDNYRRRNLPMSPLRRPRGTCCSSEKQSRRNLRWMRLISPNNNRRELVLLSRPAQTMAIHANPRAKRSPAVLRMRKSSSAIHLSPHPPSVPSPTSAFDSSASAVGAQ